METKDMTQEQISALLDSELGDAHIEGTLASLRRSEGRTTWDVYHQIGDVLRSEDMAQDLSLGFTARLLSRLDEEPPILAPMKQVEPQPAQPQQAGAGGRIRRFAMPLAIAAAAVFAIVAVPQMTKKAGPEGHDMVDANQHISLPAPGSNVVRTGFEPDQTAPAQATTVADGAVLRDPRLDQYMMDHQRYSPSWNSSAEYARSATYTVTSDGNK
jgi:sigma-E factor negative regulatory protein RseA